MSGKQSSLKKVLVNSVVYTISGLLQKCISFFLLPLYTVYLTTEDYGLTNLATTFVNTFSFIIAFSLFSAILRFYVDLKDDRERLKRFYGTIFSFVFLSGIFFFAVFTLLRIPLSKFLFGGADFYPVILICLLTLIFNCQHTLYANVLKSQQRALKSSIIMIVFFIIQVVLTIIFVVGLNMGTVGVLLATLIIDASFFVFAVIDMSLHKMIKLCFDFQLLKAALKYSIPIMPHNLSTRIALLVSNALIGGTASLGLLGIYSVATQFGNMADTVHGYVSTAYGPWLYEKLNSKELSYKNNIRKVVNLLTSVIGLFFILLSLFSQDYIVLCVDNDFVDAWRYVPLIVASYAIKTIYYFYVEILFYNKSASKLLFTATLTSSLLNVVLSSILIPMIGVYGSIVSDAVAILVCNTIIILISRKYENVGLKVFDFIKNGGTTILFIFLGLALSYFVFGNTFNIYNLMYKIVIVLVYCLILLVRFKKEIKLFIYKRRQSKDEKIKKIFD